MNGNIYPFPNYKIKMKNAQLVYYIQGHYHISCHNFNIHLLYELYAIPFHVAFNAFTSESGTDLLKI